MYLYIIVTY